MRTGWLGVDIGTTSTKAVAYDDHGAPIGSGRVPTRWTVSGTHTDIDPGALLHGAIRAANDAVADTPDDVRIGGIGLASMGETGVLVDAAGRAVGAAIAWHDARDDAEVAALEQQIGRTTFEKRTGKPLRSQFSLTKHRWLVDHEPATRDATRRFNVAEWVARGLGADESCEVSLACRTGWYDLFAGRWDDELLAWSGADPSLMPPLVEAGVAIGTVTADDAHPRLRGAAVTLCGHDHQSAALGCGAQDAGDELDSSGTAEALVRSVLPTLAAADVARLTSAGVTVDVGIAAGRWSLLGGTQGGLVMQRTLGLLGIDRDGLRALDDAARIGAARDGLAVGIKGGVMDLSVLGDVTPGALWHSVADAVTAEAASLHDTISSVVGPHRRIVAAGGWCASSTVRDAKRRHLGDVVFTDVAEPGTFGAAILAARAAGHLTATGRLGDATDRTDE